MLRLPTWTVRKKSSGKRTLPMKYLIALCLGVLLPAEGFPTAAVSTQRDATQTAKRATTIATDRPVHQSHKTAMTRPATPEPHIATARRYGLPVWHRCGAVSQAIAGNWIETMTVSRVNRSKKLNVRRSLWPFASALAFALTGALASANVLVVDGDTLDLDGTRIRIEGIDAPEVGQPCGTWDYGHAAVDEISRLVETGSVDCTIHGEDGYRAPAPETIVPMDPRPTMH